MVFCNIYDTDTLGNNKEVTILILIDGFLQCKHIHINHLNNISHNPYFNRWFSAINKSTKNYWLLRPVTILILIDGFLQLRKKIILGSLPRSHNPYFNRWFSAINSIFCKRILYRCHNPYFNRWFSAIKQRRQNY